MSTNPELLEQAATASGKGWRWFGATFCVDDNPEMGTYKPWNPLEDDGDAFRLAVKLRLTFEYTDALVRAFIPREVFPNDAQFRCTEDYADHADPCAATRCAIVRAAAFIVFNARNGADNEVRGEIA